MSFAEYKAVIAEGDTVVLYQGPRALVPITVTPGEVSNNKYGQFRHNDMIGREFGTKMVCGKSGGFIYLLHPTPELWTLALPHRTQILYGTDISTVVMELDLGPGSVVVESGTGSGSLSHALIRTIAPTGHLFTFEFHEERAKIAKAEFEAHGVAEWVTVAHADACEDGFGLDDCADAVFLDLPKPWLALKHAKRALRQGPGGRICSFSPCIEQVQRTCEALRQDGFIDITTFSCLEREYDVRTRVSQQCNLSAPQTPVLRDLLPGFDPMEVEEHDPAGSNRISATPAARMPGHTGYLSFATLPPQLR
eukprot:m.464275 g.464275  ORF g.464275 m.464275 type:complete len:308 (-) comp23413_c0_seq1:27-950(-)